MSAFHSDQDGSIPMVLIVSILVSGVIAALVATVIGTQRSVSFDRQYTEAITVADAGLQQALSYLAQLDGTEPIGTVLTSADVPAAGGSSLGQGDFQWTATKDGPLSWDVRSEGTIGDLTRVVESTIAADSDFFVAAFSELGLTFRGGNSADSYGIPGLGAVGSNNAITMNGNSYADLIFLFGATASCSGNGCATGATEGYQEELDMDAIRATVSSKHASCTSGYSAWTASIHGTVNGSGQVEIPAGTKICASEVDIDRDIIVTGTPSQDNPVEFLVTGDFNTMNGISFNCSGCTSSSTPASGAVQIYSLGSSFGLGNHNYFAAATLAPNASCGGGGNGNGNGGSNAQTEYFGSIICEDLGNQGGWSFHFDADLLGLGSGRLDISSYREETESTTSFD